MTDMEKLVEQSNIRSILKDSLADLLKLPSDTRPSADGLVQALATSLLAKANISSSSTSADSSVDARVRELMAAPPAPRPSAKKITQLLKTPEVTRRTDVVATLGPASFSRAVLDKLIDAGVNVLRLNCSHRRDGQFEALIPAIRASAKAAGRKVRILLDLQGPKFRVSEVEGGCVELVEGSTIEFALQDGDEKTTAKRIVLFRTIEQTAMVTHLEAGHTLLINDGYMRIKVTERVSKTCVKCKVVIGGKLKSRKGVNAPEMHIKCAALTKKDRADAVSMLTGFVKEIDYVALSFVQCKQDIQDFIDVMDKLNIAAADRPGIIPKIEKPVSLRNIRGILSLCAGLMVARGDLGVELGLHKLPFAQKMLIRICNSQKKYCIVATQMLESMASESVPTRAEVSDVANAIMDGAQAVMLSAESAVGKNPAGTVRYMAKIALEIEQTQSLLDCVGNATCGQDLLTDLLCAGSRV